jgi:hypothetical protein
MVFSRIPFRGGLPRWGWKLGYGGHNRGVGLLAKEHIKVGNRLRDRPRWGRSFGTGGPRVCGN